MSDVTKEIDGSFNIKTSHSFTTTKCSIIPSFKIETKPIILRLGLISFGFGKGWQERIQKTDPIGNAAWVLYYLSCDTFSHGYLK